LGWFNRWAGRVVLRDNAALEAFFSTLEHEVLSRHHFHTRAQAHAVVVPCPGPLQPQTTAQLGGVARPRRPRENRCHPAGRSSNEASTISGETQTSHTQISWCPVCNHAPTTGRIGYSLLAISE
jgi:hypothetical protein